MIEVGTCINFWKDHLELREGSLTDYQYQVIVSTQRHLADYKKMKEQVNVPLIPKPNNPNR